MSEPESSAMSMLSSIISSSDSDEETVLTMSAGDSGSEGGRARAGVGRLETEKAERGIRGVTSGWRTSGWRSSSESESELTVRSMKMGAFLTTVAACVTCWLDDDLDCGLADATFDLAILG